MTHFETVDQLLRKHRTYKKRVAEARLEAYERHQKKDFLAEMYWLGVSQTLEYLHDGITS